jgi:two-component system chemotaxis response regulator CheY
MINSQLIATTCCDDFIGDPLQRGNMKSSIRISTLKVFLIEPSRMQAHLIQEQLQRLGVLHVRVFQDAGPALDAMRREPPDLVISALHLGDLSGAELISTIRTEQALKNIAFVLISSEENPLYLDAVRQSGASAILTKPFGQKELQDAIFTTLDYLNTGSLALENDDLAVETLHILVVDDSFSSRAHLIRVLKNIGFTNFTEAENGKQGAEIILKNAFDLVMTDFNMPEMNGGDLVRFIRTKSWQQSIPIIMISSEKNEQRLAAVRAAGVTAICDKPFEPAQLKALIEQVFTS